MTATTSVPPVRREVLVRADCAQAFAGFTDDIGRWWPLATHSVSGAGGTVAFTGGLLVETGPDGTESVWGEVLAWEPPRLLRITWHPGSTAERATEVEVSFEAAGAGTRVVLVHRGWERLADPAGAREQYHIGWPIVLAELAAVVELDRRAVEPL